MLGAVRRGIRNPITDPRAASDCLLRGKVGDTGFVGVFSLLLFGGMGGPLSDV